MDFVEIFPLEIVEKIFQHLPSKDVLNCCLVSVRWREVLNSNGIWSYLCQAENYSEKEPLESCKSYFDNPTKRYTPVPNTSDRLSSFCYWRSHYNRYKYLESNWKRGKFTLHPLGISCMSYPWYCNDGILIVKAEDKFFIQTIRGRAVRLPDVQFKDQSNNVDNVILNNKYIIYSQKKTIVGLKLRDDTGFHEDFCIELDEKNGMSPPPRELTLVMSGNYLIYLDPFTPSKVFIFNLKNRALEKELVIDKVKRERLPCTCGAIEVFNKKLYMAISTNTSHNIYEYDLSNWEWGAELTVPSFVSKFYVSDGMLCALVAENTSEDMLYVWSLSDLRLVSKITINGKQPILVTNGVVFHCQNSIVITISLKTMIDSKFYVRADAIIGMHPVGKHLLAINTGDAIEVWDWGIGEKLYSPYRGLCSAAMWVDDQMIIVNKWCCNFQVIGFW